MSSRGGRLQHCLRALEATSVDVCLLTETKITSDIYARQACGFRVLATHADSANRGGVAWVFRHSSGWHLENSDVSRPDIATAELVSGTVRYLLVGCYLSPTLDPTPYLETISSIVQQTKLPTIVLGDFNADINHPKSERDAQVAATFASLHLSDAASHFKLRKRHRERYTWFQQRHYGLIRSRCDYILTTAPSGLRGVRYIEPRNFQSDHVLVACDLYLDTARHGQYVRGRQHFPITSLADPSQLEDSLGSLLLKLSPKQPKKRKTDPWITDATWQLMDRRAQLARSRQLTPALHSALNRSIYASLRRDRKAWTKRAGQAIETHLKTHEAEEAWELARRWYRTSSPHPFKPSRGAINKIQEEYRALYKERPLCGELPTPRAPPSDIDDTPPSLDEMAAAVRRLRHGKSPGPSGLRAEDLKHWLYLYENTPEEDRTADLSWLQLHATLGQIFLTGEVPRQLTRCTLVLVPKDAKRFRGIGLLEIVWKLITSIINARLATSIELHPALHGFVSKKGTGTAILETKLRMESFALHHRPLIQVFLDLSKAYDALDRRRIITVLQAYGAGPHVCSILSNFWNQQLVVPRQNGFYGNPFRAERGVTQGDIISPMLFNIVVDFVVREWYHQMRQAFPTADLSATFYADDGRLDATSHLVAQAGLDKISDLFLLFGLTLNGEKTKTMLSRPRLPMGRLSDTAYTMRALPPPGAKLPPAKRRRIVCPICGLALAASSLRRHMQATHPTSRPTPFRLPSVSSGTYTCSVPTSTSFVLCPVTGCLGCLKGRHGLRRHFAFRHPEASLSIMEQPDYETCHQCGSKVSLYALHHGHLQSKVCQQAAARRLRRTSAAVYNTALDTPLLADTTQLEFVNTFRYLGRILSDDDSDLPAVTRNIQRAKAKWAMLHRLLSREGADKRTSGFFYKAVVQAVLLYGSETWALTQEMYKPLAAFHHRAARYIARQHISKSGDDHWSYPETATVRQKAGLHRIETYIARRRETISKYGNAHRFNPSGGPRPTWRMWHEPHPLLADISDSSSKDSADAESP